jgi:hypothetical protein
MLCNLVTWEPHGKRKYLYYQRRACRVNLYLYVELEMNFRRFVSVNQASIVWLSGVRTLD